MASALLSGATSCVVVELIDSVEEAVDVEGDGSEPADAADTS